MERSRVELLNSPTVFMGQERDQNLSTIFEERLLGIAETWRGQGEAAWKVTLKGRHELGLITGANSQEGLDLLPL